VRGLPRAIHRQAAALHAELTSRACGVRAAACTTIGHVQGSLIRARLEWVIDHGSRDEIIEFFETLPPDVRSQASLVRPASWYDPAMLTEIDSTINQLFGTAWR
jgi:hypothetical protein